MAKSVVHHCKVCIKCQFSKALPPKPLPLQPILATRPWEMVGVDVLKVPMSTKGNQYLLVAQDYFSKWPFVKSGHSSNPCRIRKQRGSSKFLKMKFLQWLVHPKNSTPTRVATLKAGY